MNGRRLLVASVISIQNSHFVYPSCQNCFSKLFLNLKRYSCLKCGCSGDSKEANYRYRLSLEVADTQSVFEVTVFGSCLDVYFGVTAKDLQRYIEKLRQEIGEPDRDATPDVLFHAVESCFLGKKFVFGIKDFGKTESVISWQNDSRADRYRNALTACQMFMPNSTLIGNTVLHYLHQHQSSHFKQGLEGAGLPDPFVAFDQPSSLLSSFHGSNDLDVAPSCSADGLSDLWPQSFRLTSSPASSGTTTDPINLNPSQTVHTRQKLEDNPVSLPSQSVHNSQDHHLTVTKGNVQEDKRHNLCCSQRNSIDTKSQSESNSFLGREGGRSLQSPLEFKGKISSDENCTQHNYWLKKSCNFLPHQRQDAALGFPASSSFHLPNREDTDSQEDPEVWGEMPSSESLNEFIAKLEHDNTVVSPTHFTSDRADEFHGCFDQLSPQLNTYHANLKTELPGEKSQVLAEMVEHRKSGLHQVDLSPSHNSQGSLQQAHRKSDLHRVNLPPSHNSQESLQQAHRKSGLHRVNLSPPHISQGSLQQAHRKSGLHRVNLSPSHNSQESLQRAHRKSGLHQVNLSPSHNSQESLQQAHRKSGLHQLPSHISQESRQQAFHGSLSCKGREESGHLPHQTLVLLPSYCSTEVKSHTEESCLKFELEQDICSSENRYSRSSKSSSKCLKNSSLQIRDIAYLNGNQDGNLFKWKDKQSPWNENQTPNITNIQEDSLTLVTCEKTIGNDITKEKLLFQDDRYSFKADVGNMLQNCSNVLEVSYNASADLFDSAQAPEDTVRKLNSTHIFLEQENPVIKQCITSEFTSEHSFRGSLHERNDSWNTSLCSMPDPKPNSPIPGLLYGPERSLVGSLDFIPNSQSTPLARPCLQGRVLQGKESILSELPLNKLSWVGAKCKRPRPTLGNLSLKRLVSKFVQYTKSSDATEGQQLFTQSSPIRDLLENDGEEWVPPSEIKQIQPFGIQNGKALRKNLVRNNADFQLMENSPFFERCRVPMSSIRLLRRELSSKRRAEIRFRRQTMGKDEADGREVINGSPGFPVFSGVRSDLSSTPHSSAKVSSWSPELFSDTVSPKLSS
ncbi:DNA damage-induced apoptosis suppressor protein [Anolis sagrei]|uniref:DNA damage-induced apoptosis suppressor protein n=1 Tax=Anolis sagrei TaxID=38937 RepID=UPI00351F85CC